MIVGWSADEGARPDVAEAHSIGPTETCGPFGATEWRQRRTGAGTNWGWVAPGRVTSKPAAYSYSQPWSP